LVYDDGIVKGMLNRKETDFDDEVEICELYVEPFFKGGGVGSRLMEYLIEEAKVNHKKSICLWVLRDNLSARRFYEKNGFAPTGEEKLNEGTDIWDVKYVKILFYSNHILTT
jgi:putative acetyltransferase